MTWTARFRFRVLGLLHVLARMSPSPQRISLCFYLQLHLTTRGSVHVRLHVPAWTSKLCPDPLALLRLQDVFLADAICSWEVSPVEEAHTALGGNSRTPGRTVWETEGGLWCVIPLALLTPPPWRGNSREGPDGSFVATPLLIDPTLPNGNGQVAKEIPWGEDDVSNASTGRGQSSHSSHPRPLVSHMLIPGLRGKGGTWKMREERIAF